MSRKQITITALIHPLCLFALWGCAVPDDISESQQALKTCTNTCSSSGGHAVSCTSENGDCSTTGGGVSCELGTAQEYSIACGCANLAMSVSVSASSASNQRVTWTAHPSGGSGNYTYTWTQTWCTNGNAPGDCDGSSNTTTTTSSTASSFISRFDRFVTYCVRAHDNTCPTLGNSGTSCATVDGPGQCRTGMNCPQ